MASTDSPAASYIIDRIGQDIGFLANYGHISREDEAAIRLHLSKASKTPIPLHGRQPFHLPPVGITTSMPTPTTPNGGFPRNIPPNAQPQSGSATAIESPNGKKPEFCKAQWPYNAEGKESNDLSFQRGDIIEIVEETNEDWWTGITRGRSGLFPSNHTVKIPYDPHLFSTPPEGVATPAPIQRPPPLGPEKSTLFPPPMGFTAHPMASPPPGPMQVVQVVPQDQQKPSRFKKTGSQLGNAMVTGFGFGAGAAVAGDIVNAIL